MNYTPLTNNELITGSISGSDLQAGKVFYTVPYDCFAVVETASNINGVSFGLTITAAGTSFGSELGTITINLGSFFFRVPRLSFVEGGSDLVVTAPGGSTFNGSISVRLFKID